MAARMMLRPILPETVDADLDGHRDELLSKETTQVNA